MLRLGSLVLLTFPEHFRGLFSSNSIDQTCLTYYIYKIKSLRCLLGNRKSRGIFSAKYALEFMKPRQICCLAMVDRRRSPAVRRVDCCVSVVHCGPAFFCRLGDQAVRRPPGGASEVTNLDQPTGASSDGPQRTIGWSTMDPSIEGAWAFSRRARKAILSFGRGVSLWNVWPRAVSVRD